MQLDGQASVVGHFLVAQYLGHVAEEPFHELISELPTLLPVTALKCWRITSSISSLSLSCRNCFLVAS